MAPHSSSQNIQYKIKRPGHRKSWVDRMAEYTWLLLSRTTCTIRGWFDGAHANIHPQTSEHDGTVVDRRHVHLRSAMTQQEKLERDMPQDRPGSVMRERENFLDLRHPLAEQEAVVIPSPSHVTKASRRRTQPRQALHISMRRSSEFVSLASSTGLSGFKRMWEQSTLLLARQGLAATQVLRVWRKKTLGDRFAPHRPVHQRVTSSFLTVPAVSLMSLIRTVTGWGLDIWRLGYNTVLSGVHYSGLSSPRERQQILDGEDDMTHTTKHTKRKKTKKTFLSRCLLWLKRITFSMVVLFFFGSGVFLIWVASLEIPVNNIDDRIVAQSTKIYDNTGEILLYDVYKDERRTVVTLDEISPFMQKAIIATEDDKFYEHNGVRPGALMRAVILKLRDPSSRMQGGSTITQQTIKNALLNSDRKIERKVKEWVLAWRLEKIKTKAEILEIYLNEIPFGGPIYGVEQASLSLFGVHASELTIAQSAYLSALPKAPTTYLNDRARFDGRAQYIIGRMRDLGFITNMQYTQAMAEEVVFVERVDRGIKAPHFVFYVLSQVEEKLLEDEDSLNLDGYRIDTTLDWELQTQLEEVVATHAARIGEQYNGSNVGLVVIENKTGKIRAMIGSKDYFAEDIDGKYNIATALRQPGSTFKPFVYATAFLKGYTPDTILWDTPTEFSTSCYPDGEPKQPAYADRCYRPNNYDSQFRGPITARNALAQSLNIPAVKALYLAGIGDSMQLARELGIGSLNRASSYYGLNLVLGGGEVRLLDMAAAYGVFANDGIKHQVSVWESIKDTKGQFVDEYEDVTTQVLPANVAAMINDLLSDNDAKRPMFGQNSRLYYEDRDVAVKTGTTNNYRDVWTVGYSSDVTVAVWAGNNDNTPMAQKPSSSIVGPFWRDAMDVALKKYAAAPFNPYVIENYDELKPMLRGVFNGGGVSYINTQTREIVAVLTAEQLLSGEYQAYGTPVYHSILFSVNRADVLGPAPERPGDDPLYSHFDYGVQSWVESQGWNTNNDVSINDLLDQLKGEVPIPTGPAPKVPLDFTIASPAGGPTIGEGEKINISIAVIGDKEEIDTVYYYFNNTYLGSGNYRANGIKITPSQVKGLRDQNIIKVVVKTTDGRTLERTTLLYVQ